MSDPARLAEILRDHATAKPPPNLRENQELASPGTMAWARRANELLREAADALARRNGAA
jgi:hypothetical protein